MKNTRTDWYRVRNQMEFVSLDLLEWNLKVVEMEWEGREENRRLVMKFGGHLREESDLFPVCCLTEKVLSGVLEKQEKWQQDPHGMRQASDFTPCSGVNDGPPKHMSS